MSDSENFEVDSFGRQIKPRENFDGQRKTIRGAPADDRRPVASEGGGDNYTRGKYTDDYDDTINLHNNSNHRNDPNRRIPRENDRQPRYRYDGRDGGNSGTGIRGSGRIGGIDDRIPSRMFPSHEGGNDRIVDHRHRRGDSRERDRDRNDHNNRYTQAVTVPTINQGISHAHAPNLSVPLFPEVPIRFPVHCVIPPLVTFKTFMQFETDDLSPEAFQKKYDNYNIKYIHDFCEAFFQVSKTESWFQDRYNPLRFQELEMDNCLWAQSESQKFKSNLESNPIQMIKKMCLDKNANFVHIKDKEVSVLSVKTQKEMEQDDLLPAGKHFCGHEYRTLLLTNIHASCTLPMLKTAVTEALNAIPCALPERVVMAQPTWTKSIPSRFERKAWMIMPSLDAAQTALKALQDTGVTVSVNGPIDQDTGEVSLVLFQFRASILSHTIRQSPLYGILPDHLSMPHRVAVDTYKATQLAELLDTDKNLLEENKLSFILKLPVIQQSCTKLTDKLDIAIAYLRRVHFVTFYGGRIYQDEAHLLTMSHSCMFRNKTCTATPPPISGSLLIKNATASIGMNKSRSGSIVRASASHSGGSSSSSGDIITSSTSNGSDEMGVQQTTNLTATGGDDDDNNEQKMNDEREESTAVEVDAAVDDNKNNDDNIDNDDDDNNDDGDEEKEKEKYEQNVDVDYVERNDDDDDAIATTHDSTTAVTTTIAVMDTMNPNDATAVTVTSATSDESNAGNTTTNHTTVDDEKVKITAVATETIESVVVPVVESTIKKEEEKEEENNKNDNDDDHKSKHDIDNMNDNILTSSTASITDMVLTTTIITTATTTTTATTAVVVTVDDAEVEKERIRKIQAALFDEPSDFVKKGHSDKHVEAIIRSLARKVYRKKEQQQYLLQQQQRITNTTTTTDTITEASSSSSGSGISPHAPTSHASSSSSSSSKVVLGSKDEEDAKLLRELNEKALTECVEMKCKKEKEEKVRCWFPFCSKLFKNLDYLKKHVTLKHDYYATEIMVRNAEPFMRTRYEQEDIALRPLPPLEYEITGGRIEKKSVIEIWNKYTTPILPPPLPPTSYFHDRERGSGRYNSSGNNSSSNFNRRLSGGSASGGGSGSSSSGYNDNRSHQKGGDHTTTSSTTRDRDHSRYDNNRGGGEGGVRRNSFSGSVAGVSVQAPPVVASAVEDTYKRKLSTYMDVDAPKETTKEIDYGVAILPPAKKRKSLSATTAATVKRV